MKDVLKRLVEALLVFGLVWMMSGCNTVHGIGQDLEQMSSQYVRE